MAKFAVLNSEHIINVIVADTKEIADMVTGADCVEIPDNSLAGMGWTYQDNKFVEPVIQNETEPNSVV